jgi:hypothetical protein
MIGGRRQPQAARVVVGLDTARTASYASSPTRWPRSCPVRAPRSPRAVGPDKRPYRSTARRLPACWRTSRCAGRCARGIEQLYEAYTRHRLTYDQFTGPS